MSVFLLPIILLDAMNCVTSDENDTGVKPTLRRCLGDWGLT